MVNLIDFAIANTKAGGISHDVAFIPQCIIYQNIIPPRTEKSARAALKIEDAHMGIIVIIRVLTSRKGSQYFHRVFKLIQDVFSAVSLRSKSLKRGDSEGRGRRRRGG